MYQVYINSVLSATVDTEKEAWDVIGRSPFGSLHVVLDQHDQVRTEFIPF